MNRTSKPKDPVALAISIGDWLQPWANEIDEMASDARLVPESVDARTLRKWSANMQSLADALQSDAEQMEKLRGSVRPRSAPRPYVMKEAIERAMKRAKGYDGRRLRDAVPNVAWRNMEDPWWQTPAAQDVYESARKLIRVR